MNAARFKQSMDINVKNYSLLRKCSYIDESSHVQRAHKRIIIDYSQWKKFLKTVLTWVDRRLESDNILYFYCKPSSRISFQLSGTQVEVVRNSLQKFMSDLLPSLSISINMVKFESIFSSIYDNELNSYFSIKLNYQTKI